MEASALKQASRRGLLPRRSRLLKLQGDERLVAMVRDGNAGAFEVIVDRYQGRLLGFCRQMLRSTEDAEDILQEVFVNAYKAMIADNREINLRPWLYRIARNRCLNHLRKPTADSRESMDMVPITEAASTAETVHNREEFRQLLADVSKLPETQRTALLLREMDGLSYDEISESMDTTVPSVKSLLVRARMSLSEASEARMLTCGEVRLSLAEAAEGLSKVSAPVRRHVRDCDECANYRKQLRSNSKAFAMIFPAGPLMAIKALLLTKLGGGAAAGGAAGSGAASSGAVCAGSGAIAGGATTGAAVSGSAAAAGAAAVGGGAAATAGLATAAIGGGGAMSSAIGAKALAGVVTAAVITAGAVEVKSGTHADNTPAAFNSTPVARVAPPTHDLNPPLAAQEPGPAIAISSAVPAKSVAEEPVIPVEETVPVDPVPAESIPPVAATEETEETGEPAPTHESHKQPAGKSDSHAQIGIGGGKGSPSVPVDPDSIVIVAPTKGEGVTGPTGPAGPTGPTGPETPPVVAPEPPPAVDPSPTPPPVEPTPPPVDSTPPLAEPVGPTQPTEPAETPAPTPAPQPAPAE